MPACTLQPLAPPPEAASRSGTATVGTAAPFANASSSGGPRTQTQVAATAREIGHVPVFGPQGSLELLKHLKRRRKVFSHINNTNPMLNESGPEYRELTASGWQLAEDGWRLNL